MWYKFSLDNIGVVGYEVNIEPKSTAKIEIEVEN